MTQTDPTTCGVRYAGVFDATNAYPIWRWRRVLSADGTAVSVNPASALLDRARCPGLV